jgi:hypothetical protein
MEEAIEELKAFASEQRPAARNELGPSPQARPQQKGSG